jgi:hypothetical protein
MGTTANFSWPYPESSDFVADGATAIENLADAVDTTLHKYKFLQIVQGIWNTGVTNSTNVLADTNLAATITPTSTSSKVLIHIYHGGVRKDAGNAGSAAAFSVLRGATQIFYENYIFYTAVNAQFRGSWSATYLDSPSTTSATTYKTQFGNAVNAASITINASQGAGFQYSFIQLIEIAA